MPNTASKPGNSASGDALRVLKQLPPVHRSGRRRAKQYLAHAANPTRATAPQCEQCSTPSIERGDPSPTGVHLRRRGRTTLVDSNNRPRRTISSRRGAHEREKRVAQRSGARRTLVKAVEVLTFELLKLHGSRSAPSCSDVTATWRTPSATGGCARRWTGTARLHAARPPGTTVART